MRLTAREAIRVLHALGFEMDVPTLWQWKARGHISGGHGYDLDEIGAYLNRRATRETRPVRAS